MGVIPNLCLTNVAETINNGRYSEAKREYMKLIESVKNDFGSFDQGFATDYKKSLKTEIEGLKQSIILKYSIHNRHLTNEYLDELISHDRIFEINLKGTTLADDRKTYIKAKKECTEIFKTEYNSYSIVEGCPDIEIDKVVIDAMHIAELRFLLLQKWIII